MLSKKQVLPWTQVLQMTEEEFVGKIGATLQVIKIFWLRFDLENVGIDRFEKLIQGNQ